MTELEVYGTRPSERLLLIFLGLSGFAFSIVLGLAAGHPTVATLAPAAVLGVLAAFTLALIRPFVAYLAVAASTVMLIVVVSPAGRGVNLFDLLLPPLLISGFLGAARQQAIDGDAAESGDGHDAIRRARHRFTRAVVVYFGLAWLSLIPMCLDGRGAVAVGSMLSLVRAVEGLLLFPLGLLFLRGDRRIRITVAVLLATSTILLGVNLVAKFAMKVKRAGLSLFLNNSDWPVADPNEAAVGMLVIIALLIARHSVRPQWRNVLLASAAFVLLVLTFSRSGLLALLTFGVFLLPRARWRWVAAVALMLAMLSPLVPGEYWERMRRTLVMERGTFEVFTSMIRLLTWKTAMSTFFHNPIFGVGYLGLVSVSPAYNELRLRVGAESYVLEVAADLGIVGLIALGFAITRLLQLGSRVCATTAPGTLGHEMARLHKPLVVGLLVATLTGSNLVGLVGLGQLALWTVIMVRAGHESLKGDFIRTSTGSKGVLA